MSAFARLGSAKSMMRYKQGEHLGLTKQQKPSQKNFPQFDAHRFLRSKCLTEPRQDIFSRQACPELCRRDAKAQRKLHCHFDRREKSFLDPSHSLGMTGIGLPLGVFAPLREPSLSYCLTQNSTENFKYIWLDFSKCDPTDSNYVRHSRGTGL